MLTPTVHTTHPLPTAHPVHPNVRAACGHSTHVGPCPACQRARKQRAAAQLGAAAAARQAWVQRQQVLALGSAVASALATVHHHS